MRVLGEKRARRDLGTGTSMWAEAMWGDGWIQERPLQLEFHISNLMEQGVQLSVQRMQTGI